MTAIMTNDFDTDFTPVAAMAADLGRATGGILAGTKVATGLGWRPVQAIAEGDMVLTFDHGLQRVVRVQTHLLSFDNRAKAGAFPLYVPEDALGNLAACIVMPGQAVLVESDLAEDMLGDAFAAVPAGALSGIEGIKPVLPEGPMTVVTLHFARDEAVFGAGGVLFVCAGRGNLLLDDTPLYPLLSDDLARMVVADGVMPAGACGVIPGVVAAA